MPDNLVNGPGKAAVIIGCCVALFWTAINSQPVPAKTRLHPGWPLTDFVERNFIGSGRCAACHLDLVDKAGNDVSTANHWRSTMMANAAKDPLWQAKVQSEVLRNPALKDVIEAKCATCHMPMAWTQKTAGPGDYGAAPPPGVIDEFLKPAAALHEAAMDGVSCTVCHQIQDVGLGTPASFSGKFTIGTDLLAPDRPIFGPFEAVEENTMRTSVGFTPQFGPQVNDSALCATCHTLYTPFVDAAGKVAGSFPEQTIYLEWLHSAYGEEPGQRHRIEETVEKVRLCQDCHMPHAEAGGVMIAKYAPSIVEPKDHFSRHHFVGGNVRMMDLFLANIGELGLTASTFKIADTRARTLRQLENDTARLSFGRLRQKNGELEIGLKVKNLAGHKFPAGIPIRSAWLHLAITDNTGKIVFESGRPRPDGGITGNDADAAGFEPHYELITSPDQVQIYEGIMLNSDGEVTYTLLRAAAYAKDNRLLPAGFAKADAAKDIAVYGRAGRDENFTGGSDTITYRVAAAGTAPWTVKAELLFTTISTPFLNDLQKDRAGRIDDFFRFDAKTPKTPVLVASVTKVID